MSNGSPIDLGLLLAYCRHIRRHIGVTSNIPTICRGFSFAVQMRKDLKKDMKKKFKSKKSKKKSKKYYDSSDSSDSSDSE